MLKRATFAIALSIALGSCATAQMGSLISANKAVAKQDYLERLRHLSAGETLGEYSEGVSAQITFMKGFCLEGLGRNAEAHALYRILAVRHPNSDWAAQGKARLESAAR